MRPEQLATDLEQIATERFAGAGIPESPQPPRSSYQSQCNEVIGLLDRAVADVRLGRAQRHLEQAMACPERHHE